MTFYQLRQLRFIEVLFSTMICTALVHAFCTSSDYRNSLCSGYDTKIIAVNRLGRLLRSETASFEVVRSPTNPKGFWIYLLTTNSGSYLSCLKSQVNSLSITCIAKAQVSPWPECISANSSKAVFVPVKTSMDNISLSRTVFDSQNKVWSVWTWPFRSLHIQKNRVLRWGNGTILDHLFYELEWMKFSKSGQDLEFDPK